MSVGDLPRIRLVGGAAALSAAVVEAGFEAGDDGELAIVSVDHAGEGFAAIRELAACGLSVLAVGPDGDVPAAVSCVRAGAAEHLERAALPHALGPALQRLEGRRRREAERLRVERDDAGFLARQVGWRKALECLLDDRAERWLEPLLDSAGASSGALWAADDRGLLELRARRGAEDAPPWADPCDGRWSERIAAGAPSRDGDGVWVPLVARGRVEGLALVVDGATPEGWAVDLAAVGLQLSRRLAAARREGLRDPETGACTLSYLVDQVVREAWRSRRSGKPWSIALLRFEGDPRQLPALVAIVGRVSRDGDFVARISERELAVLLPETDRLGAALFRRRLQTALRDDRLARGLADALVAGVAASPRDGIALDAVLAAARRDADAAEASAVGRLRLAGVGFWESVERLLGTGFEATADEAAAVQRQLVHEARDGRATVWLAGPAAPEAGGPRVHVLGRPLPGDELLRAHHLALLLGPDGAYAFVRRARGDGPAAAFHTADAALVDHLVGALQVAYELPFS